MKRVRDYAEVKGEGAITPDIAEIALNQLRIDALGLEHADREILLTIIEKFRGGPVGLGAGMRSTMASRISSMPMPSLALAGREGRSRPVRAAPRVGRRARRDALARGHPRADARGRGRARRLHADAPLARDEPGDPGERAPRAAGRHESCAARLPLGLFDKLKWRRQSTGWLSLSRMIEQGHQKDANQDGAQDSNRRGDCDTRFHG